MYKIGKHGDVLYAYGVAVNILAVSTNNHAAAERVSPKQIFV